MEHRGWPPVPPSNPHGPNPDHAGSQGPRSLAYGPEAPQQSPSSGPAAHPGSAQPFPPYHQSPHGLGSLAGMRQTSPRQVSTHRPDPSAPGGAYSLPGISQATGPSDRERERAREEQIHIKEEEERRLREQDRQRMEQTPHHVHSGPPVHLHQPVAVGPRTIHGPNGLLGNPGLGGPQPQLPLGAPSGPGNVFAGGPVPPPQQAPAPANQQLQPGLLMPFAPAVQPQAIPSQQPQMSQTPGQGQQPILNDALSYLDQVKVQFADHPDVYNRFLDIMKDFKSGAIDTPGVIGRVSTLFAGNPELIQGFNTFLPPGYRIECGAGDDPNTIRVTTPMGTTVQAMPPRPVSRTEHGDAMRPSNGTFTPQPGQGAPMKFSPSHRAAGLAMPGQQTSHFASQDIARQQEQHAMHQQEQRGVSSLQNAVSAAAGAPSARPGMSPRSTPKPMPDGVAAAAVGVDPTGQAGTEKRGPVEFNHAISYVNKIKNRFAAHPDIYKQFLEILQTYQRESKPIQDVYSQVTHLFKTAPDLLEDFKQFLPESAAHAKAAERARQQAEESVMMSNVRGEAGPGIYGSPVVSKDAPMGTPNHGRGLPPVGNFAPTPLKDNKRKRADRPGAVSTLEATNGSLNAKGAVAVPPGKRIKQQHIIGKDAPNLPPPSPSLVPALPVPIAPTTTSAATSEEVGFFDRVKKAISNKNTMNEFLKLCNLFSQDLIDRSTLIHRVKGFIGNNAELMKWFQDFVGYDERDIVLENRARIPTGRVSLSNCRGLGPSYRLLPKRERQKPCSGRDELCNQVLNDEWASHPTWASEDSGFIAHRKNVHEEGLHRIEEERHDYDFNVETGSRTVQLLEPLATQLHRMTAEEQHAYRLPTGLGGPSQTIYKRVITKIYGREKGLEVIESLHRYPYQVIPVLLNRLKERLETWKMAQREWEKVWRDQTQKMFWRSLDHQAVNSSRTDKRQFQTKTLQNEIQVKHEEMRRLEHSVPGTMKKPQIEHHIHDIDVLVDLTYLLLVHVDVSLSADHPRLGPLIKEFVPLFFGLDEAAFNAQLKARLGDREDMADDLLVAGIEEQDTARLKKGNGKATNLLRQAVDRGRASRSNRKDRDDSNVSGSRASTPDAGSIAGEDAAIDAAEENEVKIDQSTQRWFEHPNDGNQLHARNIDPNETKKRDVYRLWANAPIYCFVRTFVILYDRLCKLKETESTARAVIQSAMIPKPAFELGIVDKLPTDFFADTSKDANYYVQVLSKLEDVLRGDVEFADVEDCLRRYYLETGYPLYTFEKMVTAIARFAMQILNGDGKDKTWEMWQLYRKDRVRDATSMPQQTDYRKAIEKMIKEGELYKIDYNQPKQDILFYLAKKDDPILLDDGVSPMDQENRWRSYIASYQTVDDTDAIDHSQMSRPLLFRNMRALGADPDSSSYPPSPRAGSDSVDGGVGNVGDRLINRFLAAKNEENLVMRISVGDYKTHFEPKTQEGWSLPLAEREGGKEGVEERDDNRHHREEAMRDHFVMNHEGMKGLAKDEVEQKNEEWNKLMAGDDQAGLSEDKMDVE